MLNKAKTLKGYSIQSTDGETIGKVNEFYFDDRHWTIRYLVADTGNWLTGRQVLISPYAMVAVNSDHQDIVADLTKKQIEQSPSLDSDKPVSRQFGSPTTGIMDTRCIGAAHTIGELIPILCVTVKIGGNQTEAGKRGITICAALVL